MHEVALAIALVGILIFAAHLFEAVFRKTKIPDVLLLVIIGLLLGPLFGVATPTHFGSIGPAFTTITFILILFEAGIGIKISTLRNTYKETLILSIVSFVVTVVAVAVAVYFLTELGMVRSLILAVVVGAISAAIVIPMLDYLKINSNSKAIVMLDSSISDVFSVIGTLSLIEIAGLADITTFDVGLALGKIVASFTLAIMVGMISALGWSFLLNKVRSLQNSIFTTVAIVFVVFGLTEWLGYSGAIASLAFGIMLGNVGTLNVVGLQTRFNVSISELNSTEKAFFSELVFILKTFFFVYMGISLQLAYWRLILVGLALTVIIYIVRLPVVKFSLKKTTPLMDATTIAILIPRGLAAAVMASIPFQQGISGGEIIQNTAYAIILASILMTSLLLILIEKTGFYKFYFWFFSNLGRKSGQPE